VPCFWLTFFAAPPGMIVKVVKCQPFQFGRIATRISFGA
jgi:hypothetical protein